MVIDHKRYRGDAVRSNDLLSRTGLRRIDWVRLTLEPELVRAEIIGVGFRLPVNCPIPLSLAADLIASGTPYVMAQAENGSGA
jgi:hypothetical protein